MLLFDPSPGQLIDRMTILELKYQAATKAGSDCSALSEEYSRCAGVLQTALQRLSLPERVKFANLRLDMREQNQIQWNYENEVRKALKDLAPEKAYDELANIVRLEKLRMSGNEDRARRVQEIDQLFGILAEAKFYNV